MTREISAWNFLKSSHTTTIFWAGKDDLHLYRRMQKRNIGEKAGGRDTKRGQQKGAQTTWAPVQRNESTTKVLTTYYSAAL